MPVGIINYLEKPWLKKGKDDTKIEAPMVPLFKLVENSIKENSEKTSMIFQGTRISYAELGKYIEKATSALYSIGIKRGAVVAVYLPNCPQFPISYYAIQKLGAIPTCISFLYTPREMKAQLVNSGAKSIIMLDHFYAKTKPLLTEIGIDNIVLTSVGHFIPEAKRALGTILGKLPRTNITQKEPVKYLELLMESIAVPYPTQEFDVVSDPAVIVYTSGTTGLPKGIVLSHYNLVSSIYQMIVHSGDLLKNEYTNHVLAFLPFSHVYGQTIIMSGGLMTGKTLITVPKPNIDELMKCIDKYQVGLLFGVPALYSLMVKKIKSGKCRPTSLRTCLCGADKLPQSVTEEFFNLTGIEIMEGYGLSETCSVATAQPFDGEIRRGSIGVPLPDTIVAIADQEKDEFIPVGEIGELLINGPQVMMKVWKDEEETTKCFRLIGGVKWLKTGDLAFMDDDHYFHFVDRLGDVIKYKSYRVYPQEVEQVINSHVSVREVAVVGVNTSGDYQIIKAFIGLKDKSKSSIYDEIMHLCHENLAEYKIPRAIEFVDELPKNKLGKVMKKKLREKGFDSEKNGE